MIDFELNKRAFPAMKVIVHSLFHASSPLNISLPQPTNPSHLLIPGSSHAQTVEGFPILPLQIPVGDVADRPLIELGAEQPRVGAMLGLSDLAHIRTLGGWSRVFLRLGGHMTRSTDLWTGLAGCVEPTGLVAAYYAVGDGICHGCVG
jgi:hypothetical protein